ncbi:MAG: hypothetical protein ABI333_10105 [bacterium]
MSNPEEYTLDFAALVEQITRAVLRSLGKPAAPGLTPEVTTRAEEPALPRRRIGWLLAAPCGHLEPICRELAVLQRLGHHQRVLACTDVVDALRELQGWPGESEGLSLQPVDAARGVSAALGRLPELELIYVGALGWQQAALLAELRDDDVFVKIVLQGLAAGTPVSLLSGDGLTGLHRVFPGGSAGAAPALQRRADGVWRALEGVGMRRLPLSELRRPLRALEALESTQSRALGGLLTERDVEEAAAAGLRELRLPAGAVITPLALDRARGLGVSIRRG